MSMYKYKPHFDALFNSQLLLFRITIVPGNINGSVG